MNTRSCARCGNQEAEDGTLRGQHLTRFRPTRIPFWRAGIRLKARMCRSCGNVELQGDPKELRELLRG
jgi:hypothetical protein